MYVLDTNTLVYFFRGQGKVAEHLMAIPPIQIAIPAVTVYELEVGIAKSSHPAKRRQQFDKLLDTVRVLPFDKAAASAAVAVRSALEKAGQPIGPMDTLIAGTTLACRAILVTHNTREFKRVSKLTVVDWYH